MPANVSRAENKLFVANALYYKHLTRRKCPLEKCWALVVMIKSKHCRTYIRDHDNDIIPESVLVCVKFHNS